MPEEINRVLTDQISDLLFTTEKSARENLLREGVSDTRIHLVGNVMIDTLRQNLKKAIPPSYTMRQHGYSWQCACGDFAVLTLHRPSSVDDANTLRTLVTAVCEVSRRMPIVFPMHPRTRAKIEEFGLRTLLETGSIAVLPPLGYLEMLGLMEHARMVLTDSGGIQEETTALGVPCITLRENTERPVTVEEGTNTVVGHHPGRIVDAANEVLTGAGKAGRIPDFWDGKASQRIASVLRDWLDRAGARLVA
jgi:UDP-N-acetylglucosamine 2-epimerase (non-hydrolysing)